MSDDERRRRLRHDLRTPMVLYVGSMSADKGVEDVVEAVRRLWHAGREVELVLIGVTTAPFERYLGRLPVEDLPQDEDPRTRIVELARVAAAGRGVRAPRTWTRRPAPASDSRRRPASCSSEESSDAAAAAPRLERPARASRLSSRRAASDWSV